MRRLLPALLLLPAACAPMASAVAPTPVNPLAFQSLTCEQIAMEQHRASVELAANSARQDQAAHNDAIGVFLLGLPVASMSGQNVMHLVAHHKGELEALRLVSLSKGCTVAVVAPAPAIVPQAVVAPTAVPTTAIPVSASVTPPPTARPFDVPARTPANPMDTSEPMRRGPPRL